MKDRNYRYKIIFRTEMLDENYEPTGEQTEATLFTETSSRFTCVDKNMVLSDVRNHGSRRFIMEFDMPKEE